MPKEIKFFSKKYIYWVQVYAGTFVFNCEIQYEWFIFRPPPLCGAVPADNNYIAKPADKVAARVKSDDEENWILAEVVSFNSSTNKYDVDDIDADEGKEYDKIY